MTILVEIKELNTSEEIERSYDAFLELRPHLASKELFVGQMLIQKKEGYNILGIYHGNQIVSCIGFRTLTTLAWGKILYIDDLITMKAYTGNGYGDRLLKEAIKRAKDIKYDQVHLDTGYTRHIAHYVYLKNRFELNCHHLALKLN